MAVLLRARPSSEVGQACAREEATRMATRSRGFEVQPSGLLDLTNAGTASSRQISFSATISFSGTPPASDVVTAFRSIAWRASPRDGDRMRAEMRDAITRDVIRRARRAARARTDGRDTRGGSPCIHVEVPHVKQCETFQNINFLFSLMHQPSS